MLYPCIAIRCRLSDCKRRIHSELELTTREPFLKLYIVEFDLFFFLEMTFFFFFWRTPLNVALVLVHGLILHMLKYYRGARTYYNNIGVQAIKKVGNHCSTKLIK